MKKIFPNGAINPIYREDEWVYFSTTTVHKEPYPVMFEMKKIPALIKWLQNEIDKDNKKRNRAKEILG